MKAPVTAEPPPATEPPEPAPAAVAAPRSAAGVLVDLLLGTEPAQRQRLGQTALAMALLAAGIGTMHYFVAIGAAPRGPVAWWAGLSLAGMALFFALIRCGWSRRCRDPSLTVPQMVFALASGAAAYALVGAGRGGVFPVVMVILMFGMFTISPRQMLGVSLFAVAAFGGVMALMAWHDPRAYPPGIELGHFLMVATMMPAVSVLAGQLSRLRLRTRQQRAELAQALARIRELATRDELTGLINRRHMQELMAQEHQRCVRSGQTFCLAVLDIDHFRRLNAEQGRSVGDVVLRALAHEAQRQVRASDVLSRWGGGEFVLMLPDARAPLARGGLERLHQRIGALRIVVGLEAMSVTLSAGLAEHIAGETVAQTLDRASQALQEAKAQGRNRVLVAG